MRFTRVRIENFRAIKTFEGSGLGNAVVLAGPNGSGKSSVFDAVRLLKSAYGGYQVNEYQQWFGEFQLKVTDTDSLSKLFRDLKRPLLIEADIELAESEWNYVDTSAELLLEPMVWREVVGRDLGSGPSFRTNAALATDYRVHGERVRKRVAERAAEIRGEHKNGQSAFTLSLSIGPDMRLEIAGCPVMELVFQTYDPHHLGIIDYHSPARSYQREAISGIRLNLTSSNENRAQHTLYNWQGKYQNVKSELAGQYVRELIAEKSGDQEQAGPKLNETLSELFRVFFPTKEYSGIRPNPDGSVDFPVRLVDGSEHDIDDLSSGEKEVLYGYLRLRDSAPSNSIVLLDEPELHLNPGLVRGLPAFYQKHLGKTLNNQLWMVTHSDALLREAVGNPNFTVFHMRPSTQLKEGENQAARVDAGTALQAALIDLVGDLATFQPHAKVVILEGGGTTDFDVYCVTRLFPAFAERVNLVSGGGKRRVRDLYDFLEAGPGKAGLGSFFAIIDRDSGLDEGGLPAAVHKWDRYHIENYLLEPRFVLAALRTLVQNPALTDETSVAAALAACASEVSDQVVLEELQARANDDIVRAVSVGGEATPSIADAIRPSIVASFQRLDAAREALLNGSVLAEEEARVRLRIKSAIDDGSWAMEYPGRSVLKRFVGKHVPGVSYEPFRNAILNRMAETGHQPTGMLTVINAIDAAL